MMGTPLHRRAWLLSAITTVLLLAPGCGRRAAQEKPTDRPTQAASVPLPEWAPENPSPEFLRAARVLKPIPPELLVTYAESDQARGALVRRVLRTCPAAYELFGTLSDEQIERFLSAKEIRIPAESLTKRQRAALDNWFDAWRKAMEGASEELTDYLISLYKTGAREDLSNVDVGFWAKEGRMVHIRFWIKRPDGGSSSHITNFAVL